jgi:hypothetical protein
MNADNQTNQGTVLSVPSIVDARFADHLQELNHVLKTGEDEGMLIEVIAHSH